MSFITACLLLNEKHFPDISFTSVQISSQRSSGGVGKALHLTSALLSSGSTPGNDENIYQEMDLLELSKGFERDHTEMKLQECVGAAQACRTPSWFILHGSFLNWEIQRGISIGASAVRWQPWLPKGTPQEATSF